jgi:glucosamine-6-phosphate deaminase
MKINIFESREDLGRKAADDAASIILEAIRKNGSAKIIFATGTSQFELLNNLVRNPGIDWSKVVLFHLDEYVGISEDHPASFRRYIRERVIDKTGPLKEVHLINGQHKDPLKECERLGKIISRVSVDLALVGIGENGHLAFNDPPADFITEEPFILVKLDLVCRQQQMGEGWFKTLEEIPEEAISMSIRQIMKAKNIICSVPDKRKAEAVKNCLEQEVSSQNPASILQEHSACTIYLDQESASLLSGE